MRILKLATLAAAFITFSTQAEAQNPIVTHCYTADPAPMVYEDNDSLYVYCDEDMNVPGVNDFYYMERWRVYSTVDMVNWTDHGVAMPRTTFAWGREGTCWASQCVKKSGYYFWYICISKPNDWRHYIGVAYSRKPCGPFTDILKKPLATTGGGGDIDPTVFIDNDGQMYLYFGNNKLCYSKLKTPTILDTSIGNNGIVEVPLTKEAFGGVKVDDKIQGDDCYEEGPWLDKRGDWYYLIYAAGGVPEHISYSMSKSPLGPWEYKGKVMANQDTGSFTNHSGIVNYKGKDYFFYHTGWAPGGGGFNRSMAVEEMHFNADGTIQPVKATKTGVKALCTMNPFERQQAETINRAHGIQVVGNEKTGVYVTDIDGGDSIRVANIDFGTGEAASITLRIASEKDGGRIYVRQDGAKGKILATYDVKSTGGAKAWQEISIPLKSVPKGVHAMTFTFSGTNVCNFDWWRFNDAETTSISGAQQKPMNNNICFDLAGRPVKNPSKGIYICNGKKIKY